MKKIIASLFAVLFLFACETNPPNFVEKEYGFLAVSSNLDNAIDTIKIFVDDEFTGDYSPATLKLETGEHKVYLRYDTVATAVRTIEIEPNTTAEAHFLFNTGNYKKVLLEDFANVSCDPCVTSGEIIENLLSSRYSDGSLIVLRYATNFPSPNDPFYLANPQLFDTRISFYNVLFAPTTIIDGDAKPIPTDSNDIITAIDEALQNTTEFSIDVNADISGGNINVNVVIDYPSNTEMENLTLFTVLIKKEIRFNEPPGSNGETVFRNVVTEMLPDANGESLNGEKTFEYSIPNSFGLTEDNFKVVSFIQNKLTKEILQTNTN
jgi:hypothetical protein